MEEGRKRRIERGKRGGEGGRVRETNDVVRAGTVQGRGMLVSARDGRVRPWTMMPEGPGVRTYIHRLLSIYTYEYTRSNENMQI